MSEMSLSTILAKDEKFRYMLLARMQQDCEYYLGHGDRQPKHLWATSPEEQIKYMKEIWKSFPEDSKPEWLTLEQINRYESRMLQG